MKVYFARNKKKTSIVKYALVFRFFFPPELTEISRKSLNPFFNEEFIFDVPESFYERTEPSHSDDLIHISCWDWDRLGSNEFMGEVYLFFSPPPPFCLSSPPSFSFPSLSNSPPPHSYNICRLLSGYKSWSLT